MNKVYTYGLVCTNGTGFRASKSYRSCSRTKGWLGKSLISFEKPTVNSMMRTVRYYLKYCHNNGLMKKELFSKLPNRHYNRRSKLLSTYTEEEVHKTLDTIDMGNPCDIRDYAIILLIARLGLRSRDVANIRFSNIDWEKDRIKRGTPSNSEMIVFILKPVQIHFIVGQSQSCEKA